MSNIPNILTVSRLLLLPLILGFLFFEREIGIVAVWSALALYIFCAITDYFDGWLARKLKSVSEFGIFMDPISDKIFVCVMLIGFIALGQLQGAWIIPVLLIISRELLVSGLREYLGPKNVKVPVTFLAKCKTSVQLLCLGFLIVAYHVPYALYAGQALLLAAAIITVITGGQYLKAGLEHMKKSA